MPPSPTSLRDRLKSGPPLLLDGATGTELARRGIPVDVPGWSAPAIDSAPAVVRAIHADYLAAGAEIITANTFRTHARSVGGAGGERVAAELTRRAVALARDAGAGGAWVAGSQAPLEDCYSPQLVPPDAELEREHRAMAEQLAAAGVDVILVETQNAIREAVAATRAAARTGLPVFVSFVCDRAGRLLSGESIPAAVRGVLPWQPDALLVNCLPAETVAPALRELRAAAPSIAIGAYANVGYADARGRWVATAGDPAAYAEHAREWLLLGAAIVGGCCGTTPEYIARLRELL